MTQKFVNIYQKSCNGRFQISTNRSENACIQVIGFNCFIHISPIHSSYIASVNEYMIQRRC